ncbi:transposable element Tcb2 transposase [Trichonephila clavipes]|uniref:Transposable element Tcb2 transposase n=1 Tax=Trichonephila clavipes TaxID=2585209 RepID=A0A8X6T1I2_TRICX|nr:transposable element Tcb2 transposase [Trichonephila clavipes]
MGCALPWISDFLRRQFRVKYKNSLSRGYRLSQGIPRGSVLSPILFALFIAGIEKEISQDWEIGIFVDDIIIWKSGGNIDTIESKLNSSFKIIQCFARLHKLNFNPKKSVVSFFTTNRRLYKYQPKIVLDSYVLKNCWEQWTREGTHARKTTSGASRKNSRREDQRNEQQTLVDPTLTRSTKRTGVGVAIVPQTISRHLAEANLKSKRPFRALPLTPEHRQLRLQWCQARSMWNVTDWQNVVFSEESRFVWGTGDNRVQVRRRPGYDSRSTLIVMRGTLTGQRFVDDILRPHVGPFLNGLPGAIFQQGNARPHTARVAQDFLRHFQTLPWPARSPDLSPVEHVWDQLKWQMPSCHSVHDLELAVQDLWAHLPQDKIRCLIKSMPDRVVACIAAGGCPTRY